MSYKKLQFSLKDFINKEKRIREKFPIPHFKQSLSYELDGLDKLILMLYEETLEVEEAKYNLQLINQTEQNTKEALEDYIYEIIDCLNYALSILSYLEDWIKLINLNGEQLIEIPEFKSKLLPYPNYNISINTLNNTAEFTSLLRNKNYNIEDVSFSFDSNVINNINQDFLKKVMWSRRLFKERKWHKNFQSIGTYFTSSTEAIERYNNLITVYELIKDYVTILINYLKAFLSNKNDEEFGRVIRRISNKMNITENLKQNN